MTHVLEILSTLMFMTTGLSVLACVLLAGRVDKLMKPLDSDFEEA